jgi:type IV secretion system protein VirB1
MSPDLVLALALSGAPSIDAATVQALVTVQSSASPYAIGVVGGVLLRRPCNVAEATATARQLRHDGWDFSAGLTQIHQRHWTRLGLTDVTAFDPCTNLTAMHSVFLECYRRTARSGISAAPPTPSAGGCEAPPTLGRALSCDAGGDVTSGTRCGDVQRVRRSRLRVAPSAPASSLPHPPRAAPGPRP